VRPAAPCRGSGRPRALSAGRAAGTDFKAARTAGGSHAATAQKAY